jgi:hypothetical protein
MGLEQEEYNGAMYYTMGAGSNIKPTITLQLQFVEIYL